MDKENKTSPLNIAMLGHKTIPSRQGGIEIVVEELTVRMAKAYGRLREAVCRGLGAVYTEKVRSTECA